MRYRLLILLSVSLACGDNSSSGGPEASYVLPTDVSSIPPLASLPFPNDIYRGENGGLEIRAGALPFSAQADLDAVENLASALRQRNCFSVIGGVTFPISGLEQGELVDHESARRLASLRSGDAEVEVRVTVRPEGSVVVEPARGVVLDPETNYIASLGSGLTTNMGRKIRASDDFRAIQAGTGAGPWHQRAIETLASKLSGDEIIATAFTTCAVDDDFEAIAASLEAAPPPTVVVDRFIAKDDLGAFLGRPTDSTAPGIDNLGGPAHADIGSVVLGHFDAPNYLAETAATQGHFERDSAGAPLVKGQLELDFVLVLPAVSGQATDVPVAIFQHGLNGNSGEVFGIANTMAAAGFATIAINLPFHGSRFPSASDGRHNFTGADGPDGLADDNGGSSSLYFFDILNQPHVTWLDPSIIADGFRQAVVDVMAVARLLRVGDFGQLVAALPTVDEFSFRGDSIALISESFGGFVAVPALAFEPELTGGFLAVAGGGLAVELLETSAVYGPLFMPIIQGAFSVSIPLRSEAPTHTHIIYQLLAQVLDIADPLAYAGRLRARELPVVLATANLDESVPNNASEALAAALGLQWHNGAGEVGSPSWVADDKLPPAETSATTGIVFSREPATHGMLTRARGQRTVELIDGDYFPLDPVVDVENPIAELQSRLVAFLFELRDDASSCCQ